MISIYGTSHQNIQCYTLKINNKTFLFPSKPNLQKLKYFKSYNKDQCQQVKNNQQNVNHIKIQVQAQNNYQNYSKKDFSQLKVHLDLTYLHQILNVFQNSSHGTYYIMMTHYQDFLVLPYLMRRLMSKNSVKSFNRFQNPPPSLKIFCTFVMYQMGRIYLNSFYQKIFNYDMINLKPKILTYQEESQLQDQFYKEFGVQIKKWNKLFTKSQMLNVLQFVNKMNYGQKYDADSVIFKPMPSGHSLGSSLWTFQNVLTKQTIVFVKQISTQTWRSIAHNYLTSNQKQRQIYRQKNQQKIDLLIFANSNLISTEQIKSEDRIIIFLKQILTNLEKNINLNIVLEDQLLILDIIQYLQIEMKDKFKQIFVQNPEFNQIVSYANSFVQFLASKYKENIYNDPPQYPYQSHLRLRNKGLTFSGSLSDISEKQKIPLKQLIRRSTPYLNFKSNYCEYFQKNKNLIQSNTRKLFYNQKDFLNSFDLFSIIQNLSPNKVISFTNILSFIDQNIYSHQNIGILQYSRQYQLDFSIFNYYESKDISANIINKYQYMDGYIMAYPVNRQFLRLNYNWKQELKAYLAQQYRKVLQINEDKLMTANTQISIKEYQLFIKGTDIKQIQIILQILSKITKTLRLK